MILYRFTRRRNNTSNNNTVKRLTTTIICRRPCENILPTTGQIVFFSLLFSFRLIPPGFLRSRFPLSFYRDTRAKSAFAMTRQRPSPSIRAGRLSRRAATTEFPDGLNNRLRQRRGSPAPRSFVPAGPVAYTRWLTGGSPPFLGFLGRSVFIINDISFCFEAFSDIRKGEQNCFKK